MRMAVIITLLILGLYELSVRLNPPKPLSGSDFKLSSSDTTWPVFPEPEAKPLKPYREPTAMGDDSLDPNMADFSIEKYQEDPQATEFYKD